MVHTRTFSREEIQKEKFKFVKSPRWRPKKSTAFERWSDARQAEYGPPECFAGAVVHLLGQMSLR